MIERLSAIQADPSLAGMRLGTGREVMERLAFPLEIVANLIFLTAHEAECPAKVSLYMRLAEEQMSIVSRIAVAVGKDPC